MLDGLHASADDAQCYAALATSILYANAALRADPGVIASNRQGQSGLWGYSISGDWPIVLLHLSDSTHLELLRQLIRAHAWWRLSGLQVDLVVLVAEPQPGQVALLPQAMALIAAEGETACTGKPGGIFVRSQEQVPQADQVLLQAVARIVLHGDGGPLAQQLAQRETPTRAQTLPLNPVAPTQTPAQPPQGLQFSNGLGGFSADGREYIATITPERMTPVPWINVLANPVFGSLISESGSAHTWSENAQMFRLTPWSPSKKAA